MDKLIGMNYVISICRDYRANDILDAYEAEGIDEGPELEDMTLEEQLEARARAERELNKRDRRENRRGFPGALEGACLPGPHARGVVPAGIHCIPYRTLI